MTRFLSQEWLALQAELAADLPEREGVSARTQYKVSGTPDGEVVFHIVVDNGRIVECALGEDPAAEFTMTGGYDDFARAAKGDVDASAAFMQGKLKLVGDTGKFMALMPLTHSSAYKATAEKLNSQTEY